MYCFRKGKSQNTLESVLECLNKSMFVRFFSCFSKQVASETDSCVWKDGEVVPSASGSFNPFLLTLWFPICVPSVIVIAHSFLWNERESHDSLRSSNQVLL